MALSDYVAVTKLADEKNYGLAETGEGFVVPGPEFTASISPTEPMNYIALLQYVEGELRANHYHKKKREYLVVLNGKLKCIFYPYDNPADKIEMMVEAGNMIQIEPNCVHLLRAIEGATSVLEMSPQKLDLDDQIQV